MGRGGECALCGVVEKLTDEHIYGDWMAELFPDQDPLRTMSHATFGTGASSRVEPDYHHQTVIKRLCGPCNHDWGSRLETAAKPVLTPMILRQGCLVGHHEMTTIGTWAAKVAILREYFDPPISRATPRDARLEFRRTSEPQRMRIWVSTLEQADVGTLWGAHSRRRASQVVSQDSGIAIPDQANAYRLNLGFGSLQIFIVGGPWGIDVQGRDLAAEMPQTFASVWPLPDVGFVWPMKEPVYGAELENLVGWTGEWFG